MTVKIRKVLPYWPLIVSAIAAIVWLVRLEARVNGSATKIETATTLQKLDDLKDRTERIEQKVDRLLSRPK